jgi:serine protease Do
MKKFIYKATSMGIFYLAIGFKTFAQTPAAPPPPPPAVNVKPVNPDKADQKEIIIRQKGDKDTKITVEIKNGELLINGKPADKFDDKDIIIERRNVDDEDILEVPELSYAPSPFRIHDYEDEAKAYQRAELDAQRNNMEAQRKMLKTIRVRMNEAFLGVSSKKTDKAGASVLEVTKGSPAEKAGILKGDLIIRVNDTKITDPENLFETIHNFKAGDKVKVVFMRGGVEKTVTATLENGDKTFKYNFDYNNKNFDFNYKMPPMPDMDMHIENWGPRQPKIGIKAQDAEDGKGVNILEVEDSSAAFKAGLKKGDIILQFDGKAVNSTNELIDDLQEARQKPSVKIKIQRGTVTQEIDLKIPRRLKTAEL